MATREERTANDTTTRERELESQLCTLVARHADWLDGASWMRICERVGHGYFEDAPSVFDGDAFLRALEQAFKDDPIEGLTQD